ncbi:MAG: hypothetical protein EHM83_06555 [Burkholderiales bacterium]|nr:MAG: hypothetical protein EHM83_06555 [Burkholderiales bacterium]
MHPSPKRPSIALTPGVPVDRGVSTYTRFAGYFEPYEYTDWVDESLSWKQTCYIGDWSPLAKRDNRRIDVAALPARLER